MGIAMLTTTSAATETDADFDLDVSIVASGPVVPGLMRSTETGHWPTSPAGPPHSTQPAKRSATSPTMEHSAEACDRLSPTM
jgi:FxLD family lantipeptide